MVSEPIWIVATSAREALDVVDALARRGIGATFVAGREGNRVRIAASRERLPTVLRETALAVERLRADAPLEAA